MLPRPMADMEKPASQLALDEAVEYMFNLIKRICTEVGPGAPCSPQELKRALIIKSEMEAMLGAGNVEVEETVLAPRAFFGWFRWAAAAALLSLALFFTREMSGFPLLWAGLSLLVIFPINIVAVCEFFLVREFTDRFHKQEKSQNVVGRIRRKGESAEQIKHLLIVSGHHDSAVQFNWLTYLRYGYYLAQAVMFFTPVTLTVGAGTEFFTLLLLGRSLPWVQPFMVWTGVTVVPLGCLAFFFFLGPRKDGGTVPGAADNLSGCAIALGVGRVLARRPELVPPGTEIRLITFGSEEASARGSLRYAERHMEELRRLDARVCNIDTVIDPKIIVFTSDGNGFYRNSRSLCGELARAAGAAGVPHASMPFPTFGGTTDAMPFSRFKIKAASLFSMRVPEQMVGWYHTPRDNYTLYQDPKQGGTQGLRNCLEICLEWIAQKNRP